MTLIHRVVEEPVAPAPNEIYLLKPDENIVVGVSDLEGGMVWMQPQITLSGPAYLYHSQLGVFKIHPYSNQEAYNISSTADSMVVEGDQISVTVTNELATMLTIWVNEYKTEVEVRAVHPEPPQILSPFNNETDVDQANLTISASDFALNWPEDGATHVSTDWEVATDSEFQNIVQSSYEDSVNLTSIVIP